MLHTQNFGNLGVDLRDWLPARIAFPDMPHWDEWDFNNLANNTRKPTSDSKSRIQVHEYFVQSPSCPQRDGSDPRRGDMHYGPSFNR